MKLKLQDYVGSSGKFMPFTKAVTLYINEQNIKGIKIIDTPGLDDPVKSRSKRTEEYLGLCDVIFLISHSGRFYSAADSELLNKMITVNGVEEINLIASRSDESLRSDIDNDDEDQNDNLNYKIKQLNKVLMRHAKQIFTGKDEDGNSFKDLYKTNPLDSEQYPNYRLVTNKEYYDYAVEKDNTILSDNNVTTVGELLAKLKLSEYDPYIPTNSKGEMTKEKIIVNYYYKKQAKVIVKHIDEETGKELVDSEEETKDIGDPYSAEPKTIEKYEVVKEKLPENAEGIVDEDGEEVIYYYRKVKKPIIPTANSGDTDEKQNKGEKVMSPQTGDTTLMVAIGMLIVFAVLNILEKTNMNKKGTKPTSIIK